MLLVAHFLTWCQYITTPEYIYLWIVDTTPCAYLMYVSVRYSGIMVAVGILCMYMAHTFEYSQYVACCWYIPVGIYMRRTRSIYSFGSSGIPTVRGTAGTVVLGEYFTRICCSISRFDNLDIFLSARNIWPSVVVAVLLTYWEYFLLLLQLPPAK